MNKHRKQFEFSPIAGELKGRIVRTPDLGVTRPPLSRLRKAIFDYLVPYLPGAHYLDLFSGSGSYLFEAISRGAERAEGVEKEPKLAGAINREASRLGVTDRLEYRCDDVFDAIPEYHRRGLTFDVIMIAPPQYQGLIDRTLATLKRHPVSRTEARIIAQHDTSERAIDWGGFAVEQQRKYGNTTFTVLRPDESS